jgi:hypothetical protein
MALRPRKLPIGYYVYTITVDDVVLGWTEGRNTRIDLRWAADDVELMQRFAKELVAQQPDSLSDYSGSLPISTSGTLAFVPCCYLDGSYVRFLA